jgi:hypothetical protein
LKLREEGTLVLGDNKMLLAGLGLELWSDDEATVFTKGIWTFVRQYESIPVDPEEMVVVVEDGCSFNVNLNGFP